MDSTSHKVTAFGAALLSILNTLSGLGIGLPSWADAQGVALAQAAILAVAALVYYVLGKSKAAPTQPSA
jgi:hypothetical protein